VYTKRPYMHRVNCVALLGLAALVPLWAEDVLPTDVYPDTRSRLPLRTPYDVDQQAKKAYDQAVDGFPGAKPAISAAIRLNGYRGTVVQVDSPLGPALMQLAILATAREHDQPFEWSLHEMQALAVGLDPAVIDIIKNRKPLGQIGEREMAITQMNREISATHRLSSETYRLAVKALGTTNLIDAAGLMSDYARTSTTLTAFNQQLPPGWKQFLPLPFTLPPDIRPDSRSRLPLLLSTNPALAADGFQNALYVRGLSPKGTGPAAIRSHGGGLRSLKASVGREVIDVAILVSAREHDSQYDWTMNEIAGLSDGLDRNTIDVIRNRAPVKALPAKDACLIEFGRELFSKHFVTPETYSRAVKTFGERDLADLTDVMGLHAKEALLLAIFDQQLPTGQKSLLPVSSH
jgi:hypothetical protein